MVTTTLNIATIGGFCFDRILFSDLNGLFDENRREALRLFDCVNNRYGVYLFFDNLMKVHYVGCVDSRPLKERIKQYFQKTFDKKGNLFGKLWIEKNHPSQDIDLAYRDYYKRYIKTLQLETVSVDGEALSVDREERDNELKALMAVIGDMEKFFICQLQPTYNATSYNGLTDNEQDHLMSEFIDTETDG